METGDDYKSGFVGIIGRPNVGKSTLLNNLLHRKLAIISEKPQTTRNKIRAILTRDDAQMIFVDTPGFHKAKNALGERLNKAVRETLDEVDVTVFILDGTKTVGKGDLFIAKELAELETPAIAVLNKIDRLTGDQVEAEKKVVQNLGEFSDVIEISAKTSENVHALIERIVELLPHGPRYYPEDMVMEQPESFIIGELIREKVLQLTREEVPHSVAVVVDDMEKREDKDLVDIEASIYVERDSQKGIIIGKGGKMLKEIGSRARQEIEPLLGDQVFLRLQVRVEKDWSKRPEMLKRLGY
ncbi:MAG: GTPase Era [Actinobacteria bacterium RBG_19FT_COMBO_54_7]|uniref:GTPase Era n=1 Tax=Candidatus Solincola sediminis TaxID=1797199 RepID=A0A1F2WPX9_9ACTN|nr:MAG: GTPase Era [Candidatus Solincola sediminis]OFW58927.1 MAG: GTPase Era [Candidatus Solincola sediminis]OFW70509.1 MAG: GTPase Era [Actinobacteria bacterium RBG_19FT_COMBO_54_7]